MEKKIDLYKWAVGTPGRLIFDGVFHDCRTRRAVATDCYAMIASKSDFAGVPDNFNIAERGYMIYKIGVQGSAETWPRIEVLPTADFVIKNGKPTEFDAWRFLSRFGPRSRTIRRAERPAKQKLSVSTYRTIYV